MRQGCRSPGERDEHHGRRDQLHQHQDPEPVHDLRPGKKPAKSKSDHGYGQGRDRVAQDDLSDPLVPAARLPPVDQFAEGIPLPGVQTLILNQMSQERGQ